MKTKKKKTIRVKAWAMVFDGEIKSINLSDPRKTKTWKDMHLLTKMIAEVNKKDYRIIPITFTMKI